MSQSDLQLHEGDGEFWRRFPWWLIAALGLLAIFLYAIITSPHFGEAYQFIKTGIPNTLIITFGSAVPALLIGLLVAAGCRSKHLVLRNLASFYLAVVGGIPTIIVIFLVTLVLVPIVTDRSGIEAHVVPTIVRAIIALSLAYGAIYGDVFRLGAAAGGRERAGKSPLRPTNTILVAAGITFIALLKDSSLASLLAVREITQYGRLHAGATFQFTDAYGVVVFLYLVLTIPLRLLTQQLEQRAWRAKS